MAAPGDPDTEYASGEPADGQLIVKELVVAVTDRLNVKTIVARRHVPLGLRSGCADYARHVHGERVVGA